MDMDQLVIEIADQLNENVILNNVKVPVLVGYEEIPNHGTILTAISPSNSMEQFLCDGIIQDTFEEHVERVIRDIHETMEAMQLETGEDLVYFLKDYKTKDFTYKIYVQDMIGNGLIIRQFDAFFVDPKTNAFYQISLSGAPYPIAMKDHVEGKLHNRMISVFESLLDKVSY